MPAHRAAALLPDTLAALAGSDLPREAWELIVVDDGSDDDTGLVAARWADRVIRLPGPPRGPGHARNAGARAARAPWVVFVDADVRAHPDMLRRIAAAIARDPAIVAVFGSYDDQPQARGLLTEYRNLLHRYVHCREAGDAQTFWAGCGAVRRDAFEAVGGFDVVRFSRPQIEDIELGYRLRDRGGRIVLDPSVQGTHLKRWRFATMVRTDVRDRGIPWMRLLLERRGRTAPTLNTGRVEQVKVALSGLALVAVLVAVVLRDVRPLMLSGAVLLALVLTNLPVYSWFARERGTRFALSVVPLHLLYYLTSAVAATIGIALHLGRPRHVARAA